MNASDQRLRTQYKNTAQKFFKFGAALAMLYAIAIDNKHLLAAAICEMETAWYMHVGQSVAI